MAAVSEEDTGSGRVLRSMLIDQPELRRLLHTVQRRKRAGKAVDRALARFTELSEQSQQRRARRESSVPAITFPPDLPVVEVRDDIAAAIRDHPVVIVCGETGSGKTTQLPKICLSLGRGVAGLIGHTQPRRIAARNVSARIAEELGTPLGAAVGYKVRFNDRVSDGSYIKVMTDGILLAETRTDPGLWQYDTLIIDEAHERSLNIDFLLGYIKRLLPRRPDLKIIITSATIDTRRFAGHFDGAPVIQAEGRSYPVELRYARTGTDNEDGRDRDQQQAIIDAIDEARRCGPGDILVFLSGERDIRETAEALRKHRHPDAEVIPLFARLGVVEQQRVFKPGPLRRIVLATNVAETSLTVPRIRYVIDTGLARISRYSLRSKVQRLPIERISQASANQRAGRCGRLGPGVCFRLYSEEDFDTRAAFIEPEIQRTNLAGAILQMHALKLGEVTDFPFVDPPSPQLIRDGIRLLQELSALDAGQNLTTIGNELARLPVDPRLGRMLIAAREAHCLQEMLIIVAALSIQDPRERPLEARQAADEAHGKFNDKRSDFVSLVNLWNDYEEQRRHLTRNKLRKYCKEQFLSFVRMREWHDIHQQLLTELSSRAGFRLNTEPADYAAVHRALLSGLLGQIGFMEEARVYRGARNTRFSVFPGSGLAGSPPKWLVCAELVETTRLYARICARIQPEWVEAVAGDRVQRSYTEPHWQDRAGQVAAWEKTSIYGLTLNARRRVNFGPIDPVAAREVFIQAALVEGRLRTRAPFLAHNRGLVQRVAQLEDKARRRDILVDERDRWQFYDARLPAGIYSAAQFEKWHRKCSQTTSGLLFMGAEDVMAHSADEVSDERFPDQLDVGGHSLAVRYHFLPGDERDGTTVEVPLVILNQLSASMFDAVVPGLLREKIIALLRGLPKSLRTRLVPVPDRADSCLREIDVTAGDLLTSLGQALLRQTGVKVTASDWQAVELPLHLRMAYAIIDEQGEELARGHDLAALQATLGQTARSVFQAATAGDFPRREVRCWDFGELPESVEWDRGSGAVTAFPALVDQGDSIAVELFENPAQAQACMGPGLARLFLLQLPDKVKYLRRSLPDIKRSCLFMANVPDAPPVPGETLVDKGKDRCDTLCMDIILQAMADVFVTGQPALRDAAGFDARLSAGRGQVIERANETGLLVHRVLVRYVEIQAALDSVPAAARQQISTQLQYLVHDRFVYRVSPARLHHFPRYLSAIQVRLEKLAVAPAKDSELAAQVEPFQRAWLELTQPAVLLLGKEAELEEYRWMIEEFRVSVFAQQLRTPRPVSAQRLQRQLDKIRRP